jgi:hypothetical protein
MKKGYTWLLRGRESARSASANTRRSPNAEEGEEIRLFVRGDESIRITTHPLSMTAHVFGPGRLQKSHEFASAADFGEFLGSLRQQMMAGGWTLLDVADRRQGVVGRSDQMEGRRP